MKFKVLALVMLSCLSFALFGQKTPAPKTGKPTIAVFDASIPKGFDSAAIIPITDSLSEELVNSGKYMVLDRAHIQVTLQEKAFKLSELVNDSEAKSAGEMLGAEFVVVIRVQNLDGTLFLSAKMINVVTGEIQAQASSNVESQKIAKLIELAHMAGAKLAGGAKDQTGISSPASSAPTSQAKEPVPSVPQKMPQKSDQPNDKKPPYSHIVVGMLAPVLFQDEEQLEGDSSGFQLQWMQHLLFGVYVGAEYSSLLSGYPLADADVTVTGDEINFLIGYILPIGNYFQIYGGIKTGLCAFRFEADGYDPENPTSLTTGFECGIELSLFRIIPLVLEFDYTGSSDKLDGLGPMTWSSFMLGIGFSY